MIKGIGHIGIFVRDIEKSLASLSQIIDFPAPDIREPAEAQKRCAVVDLGNVGLEFIQDMTEDGLIARLVKERGDSIHHLCLLSDDVDEDFEKLKERGIEMLNEKPKIGLRGKKCALSASSALNGITVELSEP